MMAKLSLIGSRLLIVFNLYPGIKKALLDFETFNFEKKEIPNIPAHGLWLKECVKSLERRVVNYLESKKMIEYEIDKPENDELRILDIWKFYFLQMLISPKYLLFV